MENQMMETGRSILPKWLVKVLGVLAVLLIVLVAVMIAQKVHELKVAKQIPARTISVNGEGKITITPDLATVSVGVLSQGENAKSVKDENNKKVAKIIEFVKKQGIEDKDIKTSQFNFYPQQDWQSGRGIIVGYQVTQSLTIKVRGVDKDQSKLDAILDSVVENGANQIDGISLTLEKPEDLYNEARKLATEDAKKNAKSLTEATGLKLGKIVDVYETTPFYDVYPYEKSGMGGGGAPMANVMPGTTDQTLTLTVQFEVK